jgi:tetratricopeptide (TPR) repeat protein
MPARLVPDFHRPTRLLLCAACCTGITLTPLTAQPADNPALQAGRINPDDVFFQGYLAVRAAEQLEKDQDYTASWEKYDQARKMFETVGRFHPDWKPNVISSRMEKTRESLTRVRPLAEEQRQRERGVIAELEGGVLRGGTDAPDTPAITPGILEVDPLADRRLKEAEAEVERLRQIVQDSTPREAARTASRLQDMQRQRDDALRQLRAAETNVQALRARLSTSPVESEMSTLNRRIEELEQEREAMALALRQSRGAHTEALARGKVLEADLEVLRNQAAELRQREADLNRDLAEERKVAAEVVQGQRRQINELERKLEEKSLELSRANEQIASLTLELKESRDAYAELHGKHETLQREQEQMRALLNLNEDSRIDDLIEQNMSLARDLREANEKVERLNLESNATKDQLSDAIRDLGLAKARINRLIQEKRLQDQQIGDLQRKLRQEETALAEGSVEATPEEVEALRGIIKRQLRSQERRRQAREVLVEAAKALGARDERLAKAIELFDAQEIELTPEEQRLLADRQVDGEFVSPVARDLASVRRATAELNRDVSVFERAAERSFLAGRFGPTRELFQLILEQNPGHTPALCKIGVVHLKLKETEAAIDAFRRAAELDADNPYAHRMLGVALMAGGDLSGAETHAARSAELSPDDARCHLLLGVITQRLGRLPDAERHYKSAIAVDPLASEAYFNLAILYSNSKRLDEAKGFYQQALERGAIPDPALEDTLYPQG